MFGGNFAPVGWMFCAGQLLPISQFDTLFNLIGTTYGGDGQSTFALPDLRGRLPLHQGSGFTLGGSGGSEQVTLTTSEIPAHGHPLIATKEVGTRASPQGNLLAQLPAGTTKLYHTPAGAVALAPSAVGATGGSQPHPNFQPYLCVSFIISLFGIFPSQT
jgi:microcystin-dependent protein